MRLKGTTNVRMRKGSAIRACTQRVVTTARRLCTLTPRPVT